MRASPIEGVFGLSAACSIIISDSGFGTLVSPGILQIDQSGEVSNVRLVVEGESNTDVVGQWLGVSGIGAGDLVRSDRTEIRGEPLLLSPLGELVADAPGEWTLALTVPRTEAVTVSVGGVEYDLDGRTYRIDDDFELTIRKPCS